MLRLIRRNKSYIKGYKEYCQEYYDNNIVSFKPTNPQNIDDEWFENSIEWYAQKEQGLLPGHPKSIHYWAIDEDKFIGEFQLRPELNNELMKSIGSIGYSVRFTEWGKGYGKEILKQGLEISKSFGLNKVLLIINDDNIRSCHLCELNGGILMDKVELESIDEGKRLVRRYWVYI